MLRKLLLLLGFVMVLNIPLAAQHVRIELSYQSFRPFIHFQLDVDTYRYDADPYDRVYLQGYMDGVNDEYFYGPALIDIFRYAHAYRAGYRDGLRDRALLIQLRGHRWYRSHRFAHGDYYAPTIAVQIWLEGLSLAFLQAPAHRLPPRWQYRAHAQVEKYRKWMNRRTHGRDNDDYYNPRNVERRFTKRIRKYQHKLNDVKKKNRRSAVSRDRDRIERKRNKRLRRGVKAILKSQITRSDNRSDRSVRENTDRDRRVQKDRDRRSRSRGDVNKKRERNSDKSKRSRSHRGNRDRDN